MLDNIIRFSIRNKLIIGLFTLAIVAWGINSVSRLPIDALPDITNNQVQIITQSPALSALDVERLISFPIEQAMATVPNLLEIRSISRFGLSVVTIVFKDNVDIYLARQQVSERLLSAKTLIPANAGDPELAPVTTGLGEIYQYVIRPKEGFAKKYSPMDLRTIQDWIVRRQLLGTKGVADVSSFGGLLKQYEVAVDPQKLRTAGVTIDQLFSALEENNQNAGGAYIDRRPNAYFIRSEGLISNLDDIGKIEVRRTANDVPILVRDVATVQLGNAVRYGAMTRNDEGEVVGAIVMMLKGENSAQVINNIKERIAQIEKSLPEGVEIHAFLDRSKLVDRAIGTVEKNLVEGALIVIFVLVLLLGNWRAGLVVASVIPLAMLFAISLMNIFGVSGNLMSLGAIDFGLIVDGAVIIVEATLHHIAFKKYTRRLTQEEMDEEVYESASRIRSSAAFGEIIILIVYLPILALVGIEGKMFRPMAQTVAFAILGAFILSLTYVPMMSALLLSKKPIPEGHKNISDRIIDFFHRLYDPVIRWTLNHKKTVVGTSVALFVLSIYIFSGLGGEFIPQLDEGDFAVETRVMTGSSLSQSKEASLMAGRILKENFPEVIETIGKTGAGEIPTDPMPIEATDLMVILKDRKEWTSARTREELAEKMQEKLNQIPGVSFGFLQPIQMRFSELISGVKQDIAIKLYGEDLQKLAEYADKIGKLAGSVQGAEDLYVEQVSGLPQIVIRYDRDALSRFGISVKKANRYLQTAFAGTAVGQVYDGERRFDLVVRLEQQSRQKLSDVQNMLVETAEGENIPLSQIASIEFQNSTNQVQREDAKRRIIVAFNVRGRDVESVVNELKGKIEQQIKLPSGYFVTYGGQFQNLQEAKDRLMVAVPIALALIFLLLFFTFKSISQSILIFSAIPLSAIGGVVALWLRDMPFSISAGVGFIALFGVAVLNGIVLIGEFNHLKDETDLSLKDRILLGTSTRLRPVLMTALVASLGFLPMALATTAGAEVQRPLATVVIGGLVSATLLTLLVLPCLYWWDQSRLSRADAPKRPNSGKAIATFFAIGLFFSAAASAQSINAPLSITLDDAIKLALAKNQIININALSIKQSQAGHKIAKDLGPASLSWTGGQYNGIYFDNNFTLSQSVSNPTLIRRQVNAADAFVQVAEGKAFVNRNALKAQVKSAYTELQYILEKKKLLISQDSLLSLFLKATQARQRTGEGTVIELATAQNQVGEIENVISQTQADELIALNRLQVLLNTKSNLILRDTVLIPSQTPRFDDSTAVSFSPEIRLLQQQIGFSHSLIDVERAKLLPGFTLGYINQSLIGTYTINSQERTFDGGKRFHSAMIGVSMPLFRGPQKARIKAAQLEQELNEATLSLARRNMEGDLKATLQDIQKLSSSLLYYQKTGLPVAQLLSQKSGISFKAGEIDYLQYSQALTQAYQTRANYITVVAQYNQSIIRLEQLLGL